jgi:hypothetical protein
MEKWIKVVWAKKKYNSRDAKPGYAPDPDWSKLPTFDGLVITAFGKHYIIKDDKHPVYRDAEGEAPKKTDDDL